MNDMMKRLFLSVAALLLLSTAAMAAEKPVIKYVDAQTLNHIGKMCKTTNPYNRVEVADYQPELTKVESERLICSAGQAILFTTDATEIWVKAKYGYNRTPDSMPRVASHGFNLFIQKDGEWLWAASKSPGKGTDKAGLPREEQPLKLIANMDGATRQCMLYLPLFSELTSLEVGVPEGSLLEPLANPFRHNIAIFGSSFTQGASASGAGLTYPAFLQRQTGLNLCSFGMSGQSKLQRVMGEILGGTMADAYICDSFSNPTVEEIGSRIRPFLDEIRKRNPKAPVIFLRTIYRESRNFDTRSERRERERIEFVEALLNDIVKEYNDVYYVAVPDQTGTDHLTSADGTHPYSWGYKRWADAIQPEIVKILKKYNLR